VAISRNKRSALMKENKKFTLKPIEDKTVIEEIGNFRELRIKRERNINRYKMFGCGGEIYFLLHRWWLYVTLYRNAKIRQYRKHYIVVSLKIYFYFLFL
jgi:hypothetical protein